MKNGNGSKQTSFDQDYRRYIMGKYGNGGHKTTEWLGTKSKMLLWVAVTILACALALFIWNDVKQVLIKGNQTLESIDEGQDTVIEQQNAEIEELKTANEALEKEAADRGQ